MNDNKCWVCGSEDVVQNLPVPLCLWHQNPPEDPPVLSDDLPCLLPWEEELEEYYPTYDDMDWSYL